MNSPEHTPVPDESFEDTYKDLVVDLIIQSRFGCHDRAWVEMAAGQLTDMVVARSGQEKDDVREQLNALWSKIHDTGLSAYIEENFEQ